MGKLRGLLQANYTIYTLMAPRRQLYRSSSPSPSRRLLCSCCCCCLSLPDDWGKVRLRNFHKQHEALLEEVFASSIGCMSPGCWHCQCPFAVTFSARLPHPLAACQFAQIAYARWDKGASERGTKLPAVGASCQFDGSAWLSMYVHLNCQLVCVRVCITVCLCV